MLTLLCRRDHPCLHPALLFGLPQLSDTGTRNGYEIINDWSYAESTDCLDVPDVALIHQLLIEGSQVVLFISLQTSHLQCNMSCDAHDVT